MNFKKAFFLLGAEDPEMNLIEKFLKVATRESLIAGYGYALIETPLLSKVATRPTKREPTKCTRVESLEYRTNAYQANAWRVVSGSDIGRETLVTVECDITPNYKTAKLVVDHHRPGDPGFGKPPSEAIPASSLGQILRLFASVENHTFSQTFCEVIEEVGFGSCYKVGKQKGKTQWPGVGEIKFITDAAETESRWLLGINRDARETFLDTCATVCFLSDEVVVTAAADHNLHAAYTNQIPGVRKPDILKLRIPLLAARSAVVHSEVWDGIREAERVLFSSSTTSVRIGNSWVKDLRSAGFLPYATEVAAMTGKCCLARGAGNKVFLSATPELVRAFLEEEHRKLDIEDVYGDPAREFAGGYQMQAHDQIWAEQGNFQVGLVEGRAGLSIKLLDENEPNQCFLVALSFAEAENLGKILLQTNAELKLQHLVVQTDVQGNAGFIHDAGTWTLNWKRAKRLAEAITKATARQ